MKKMIVRLIVVFSVMIVCMTAFGCKKAPPAQPENIDGVIQYVLGVSDQAHFNQQQELGGERVWLTAANIKIEFDIGMTKISDISLENSLRYWQSVVGYLDGMVYGEGYTRTNKITLDFDAGVGGFVTDIEQSTIKIPTAHIETVLNPNLAINNGAWQIFFELGKLYSFLDDGSQAGFVLLNDTNTSASMFALLASMHFTDALSAIYLDESNSQAQFLKNSHAMTVAIDIKTEQSDYSDLNSNQRVSMFALLIHRFGSEKLRQFFTSYNSMSAQAIEELSDTKRRDELLIRTSKAFGYDLCDYFSYFRLHFSHDAKSIVSKLKLPAFYPVAVKGIEGSVSLKNNEEQNKPQAIELDFTQDILSLYGDVEFKHFSFKKSKETQSLPKLSDSAISFTPTSASFDYIDVFIKTPSEAVKLSGGFRLVTEDEQISQAINYDYSLKQLTKIKGGNVASSYPLNAIKAIKIVLPTSIAITAIIIIIIAIKKYPKPSLKKTIVR